MAIPIWFRPKRRYGDGFTAQDRGDIQYLIRKVRYMSDIATRLRNDVAAQATVIASVQTLMTGLADRIRAATDAEDGADETELSAIADELEQNSSTLAQAVQQNTPADPASSGAATSSDSGSGVAGGSGSAGTVDAGTGSAAQDAGVSGGAAPTPQPDTTQG